MTITITGFANSPDKGKGLARDMRVRWALEEAGLDYQVHGLSFAEMKEPAHLARQPFGQIPTYTEGDLTLFETGAIVLHIAENHPGLFPEDSSARARAIAWMFAAASDIEPLITDRDVAVFFEKDKAWQAERLATVYDRIRRRLKMLSDQLGENDWLDGAFSAGDLMMADVLRRLVSSGVIDEFPALAAYVARAEARPAFQRAYAAQKAAFEAGQATG
ncbi:MAG: glutathione S-transferase family protein [Sphingomonas sp.]|uniref:glutathione S-transferase family protein n=1 Tax=Sphingomonas sp. TaxID=28214 RepID=UPI0025DEBB6D|nr:glutathione S-transferase family protein [Sphingomonas sp.]MBX3565786.1 glutathione S-transferase family protein [Sphingomonas sp.]